MIEVLTVVFIFSLIMLAIFTLYINYQNLLGTQEALIDTAGSASASITDIQNSVLQADHVVASYSFSGTDHTSTTTSLVLELPSRTSDGDIVAGSYDYIAYYASSTTLYRTVEAAVGSSRQSGTRSFSHTLNMLAFTYDSSSFASVSKITVDITTEKVVKQKSTTAHLNQDIYLRNF
ncbi:MAG: hypothetical protein UY67_C0035G0016 [Candidatus Kaiserbacteria bacterium GW2011_GWA2_52_12]|uniref:Uncharacterized protein n=1 Tax=Candidatus Kaiserbacteria bacterium GW2011_GWA2_52_12 TaxID=1618671 RepID=A0A0G1WVP4_9BACT|nr:MAG: hypothetical protein UY67_C0035G0016 [Candidatus Kaiserbacteria bacterium GW2011_GWA2_52_12]